MAIQTIHNDSLSIAVNTLGAELTSLQCNNSEYLWQGNPDTWNGRAPILFPIIGPLLDGTYQLDGKNYPMAQHGFARRCEWQVVENQADFLLFRLGHNKETLAQYPFQFTLEAGYLLLDSRINCSYRVVNRSSIDMPFAIGSHTAFRVPINPELSFSDYELEFEREEDTVRYLQTAEGPLSGETVPFRTNNRKLALDHSFFAGGSIIFKNLASERITIQSPRDARKASITFGGFPYCTLWTYQASSQPYLCIEPWYGITATLGSSTDFRQREGNQVLKPQQEFHCQFQIILS